MAAQKKATTLSLAACSLFHPRHFTSLPTSPFQFQWCVVTLSPQSIVVFPPRENHEPLAEAAGSHAPCYALYSSAHPSHRGCCRRASTVIIIINTDQPAALVAATSRVRRGHASFGDPRRAHYPLELIPTNSRQQAEKPVSGACGSTPNQS